VGQIAEGGGPQVRYRLETLCATNRPLHHTAPGQLRNIGGKAGSRVHALRGRPRPSGSNATATLEACFVSPLREARCHMKTAYAQPRIREKVLSGHVGHVTEIAVNLLNGPGKARLQVAGI